MMVKHLGFTVGKCRIMCKLAVDSVKIDSYEESACDFDQSQAEE